MSYQVLARKWRPQAFDSMVGQSQIRQALANALSAQRLHHAYLFTGTRGVGKTTIARIFAKALACEKGISATPCGECTACTSIQAGHYPDLIEVDAASRTKVEDTRDLLENVSYAPTQGRFKIYLIDEVHMLSSHSFNALLKTLEEPPEHVKFLLATTDPKRLPMTILSRCLQFNLKALSPEMIQAYLQDILSREQIDSEPEALRLLAQAAMGSVRDALSLLDQAIIYSDGPIKLALISDMLGMVSEGEWWRLLQYIAARDAVGLLQQIAELAERSADFDDLLAGLLSCLHTLALRSMLSSPLDPQAPYVDLIASLSSAFTAEDIQLLYQIALKGRTDLPFAASPRQGFEMIVLRMLAFYPLNAPPLKAGASANRPYEETKTNPHKAEASAIRPYEDSKARSHDEENKTRPHEDKKPEPLKKTEAAPTIMPKTMTCASLAKGQEEQLPDWMTLLAQLGLTGVTATLANQCVLKSVSENRVLLAVAPTHSVFVNDQQKQYLSEAFAAHWGRPIQVEIRTETLQEVTPAQYQREVKAGQQEKALERLMEEPLVQEMMAEFDAKVDTQSVRLLDETTGG